MENINFNIRLQIKEMPKRMIRFNIPNKQSKKGLFLRDPKASFIVILEKKIFPLHRQLLSHSQYFQQLISKGQKSVVISHHINANYFEQILGCFYGIEASFERHLIIDNILPILALLKVDKFDQQLKIDMRNNFEEYGLFGLFQLSKKLSLEDVEEKCMRQLIDQQFQQINYNKYDLFQLGPELFTFVCKQHQRLKARKQIKGLDKKLIKAVCQQYCKTNSVELDIEEILNYGNQSLNEQFYFDEDIPRNRRRNATQKNKQEQSKRCENLIFSQSKLHPFEEKSDELKKIRIINSSIQENNNRLAAEIMSVRTQINGRDQKKQIESGVYQIDKKLKQFEEKSKNAHKKMEQLKNKMLRLNNDQLLDRNDEENIGKIFAQKGNLNHKNNGIFVSDLKILSKMAVLEKSKDIDSDSSDF